MWLLPTLVRRDAVAIDVGAANGVYAYFLQRLARTCHALRPTRIALRCSRRLLGVTVHACALSDACGEAELRVPVANGTGLCRLGHDRAHERVVLP